MLLHFQTSTFEFFYLVYLRRGENILNNRFIPKDILMC